jgi:SAM-dependent methyltransferase
MNGNTDQIRATYDAVASEYATRISDELAGKPLDCALLGVFAQLVGPGKRLCDAGCGPGHVTRFLYDRGMNVYGVDLSPKMIAEATRRHPGIEFQAGDLTDLAVAPGALAGVVAFYSLIHQPRERMTSTLARMRDLLRPGALLFIAFHIGNETLHLDEWWERAVDLDFIYFEIDEMKRYLTEAGYELDWVIERSPYLGVEHPTRRAYVLARKPD